VECMWLILQQDKPDDYVVATGQYHSVREFCTIAFKEVGIELEWQGEGVNEKGIVKSIDSQLSARLCRLQQARTLRSAEGRSQGENSQLSIGSTLVEVDPKYFRPAEVDQLLGDPTKAKTQLGWNPQKTSFEELVKIMVQHDMKKVRKLYLRDQLED